MNEVSISFDEKARKNASSILKGLSKVGQTRVAEAMDVSDATVSRMKDEQIDKIGLLLTACGLKVVLEEEIVIDPTQLMAVESLFKSAVAKTGMADLLRKVTL